MFRRFLISLFCLFSAFVVVVIVLGTLAERRAALPSDRPLAKLRDPRDFHPFSATSPSTEPPSTADAAEERITDELLKAAELPPAADKVPSRPRTGPWVEKGAPAGPGNPPSKQPPAFGRIPADEFVRQHEAEARSFLGKCNQSAASARQECLRLQRDFVVLYVNAFTGDKLAMAGVLFAFADLKPNAKTQTTVAAVPPRPFEACAWAYQHMVATHYDAATIDPTATICAQITPQAFETAKLRAAEIARSIDTFMQIPDGWEPDIPGLQSAKRPRTRP